MAHQRLIDNPFRWTTRSEAESVRREPVLGGNPRLHHASRLRALGYTRGY